jgi:hypothetical protein
MSFERKTEGKPCIASAILPFEIVAFIFQRLQALK